MDPPPSNSDYRDTRDYIRVLVYSYYTTITGWGVLLIYIYIYLFIDNGKENGNHYTIGLYRV